MALIPPGEEGIPVLQQAFFFQQSLGMRVFLYRILEKPSFFQRIFQANEAKNERARALKNFHEFASAIIPNDLINNFTYRIKYGGILEVLLRQSKKGGYEFIIVGKDGSKNCLEPTELDKLISRSSCPIMTINKKHALNEIKTIVIPVDISQTTQKKLLWATYFAKKYRAKVIIVSALSLNIDLKKSLAWRNAEKLKHMLSQRDIDCEVTIIKEKEKAKHEVILDCINKINQGLVIIRTHQKSNMKDTQIGNFVSNIVHGSKIPVFTVNRFLYPMPVDFELNE